MSKATDLAKISVKGGFHLMWGLVASTVISAVGTIIIASLLGEGNYGLYGIVLTAPTLIVLFRNWGINNAIICYTAQSNAEDRKEKIRSIFLSGLIFEIALGAALFILSFALSDFLAADIFSRPSLTPLLQIASFTILTSALVTTASAAFVGIERTHFNSIMVVAQAIIKTALIVALVLLGLGLTGAVTGLMLSSLIAGFIGITFMYTIYRKFPKPDSNNLEIAKNIKKMLKYGIPISVGVILTGFLLQYYNFLLYIFVSDNSIIGNYTIAQNFVVLITFFAQPVTTMIFPAFSKLNHKKEPETLKNMYQNSIKYASLLVVPFASMVMVLSQPAISTLFGNQYVEAPLFLSLLAIMYLYPVMGSLSNASLINGQGQTTFNLIIASVTAAVGLPIGFILISGYGVLGLITTALTAILPGTIISLIFIKKRYNLNINWKSSLKILFSSLTAAALTYLLTTQLASLTSLIRLIIGVTAFAFLYIISAILTRTITQTDLNNLREMFSTLGPISRILAVILSIIEKIMTTLTPNKAKNRAVQAIQ
jgi:O-antigen/teichoic acid export membrane protein